MRVALLHLDQEAGQFSGADPAFRMEGAGLGFFVELFFNLGGLCLRE
jgi:hypothetical protein